MAVSSAEDGSTLFSKMCRRLRISQKIGPIDLPGATSEPARTRCVTLLIKHRTNPFLPVIRLRGLLASTHTEIDPQFALVLSFVIVRQ